MKKFLILTVGLIWMGLSGQGQQLVVTSPFTKEFQLAQEENKIIEWKRDKEDKVCAQLRIRTTLRDLQFEGDGICGMERITDEYRLWLSKGTSKLRVTSGMSDPLDLDFKQQVTSGMIYSVGIGMVGRLSVSEKLYLDETDVSASKFNVTDSASGKTCALVQLGLVLDSVEVDEQVNIEKHNGGYWIWLAPGTKTMTIRAKGYAPLVMHFDAVQQVCTYRATVSLPKSTLPESTIDQSSIDKIKQPAEEAYETWKGLTGKIAVIRGEEFLSQYPNSEHAAEIRSSLYHYYYKKKDYKMAGKYVRTDAEKRELAIATNEANKREKARQREQARAVAKMDAMEMFESIKWKPWTTFGLDGGLPYFFGFTFDFYPFVYTSQLNLRIGGRYAEMTSNTWNTGDCGDKFKYNRVSPEVSVMWGGETFYLALGAMANFNSGYTYKYLVAHDTVVYKTDGLLNPFNVTLRAEAMWLIEDWATLYAYYNYDITPAFDSQAILQLTNIPADPHYTSLKTNPWLEKQFGRRGVFGLGISINIFKGIKIN